MVAKDFARSKWCHVGAPRNWNGRRARGGCSRLVGEQLVRGLTEALLQVVHLVLILRLNRGHLQTQTRVTLNLNQPQQIRHDRTCA